MAAPSKPRQSRQRPPRRVALPQRAEESTSVQTIICSKERFDSAAEAAAWCREHDYKGSADDVDETEETYRFRQFPPGDCAEGTLRTIDLTEGVQAVVCRLSEARGFGPARTIQMAPLQLRAAVAVEDPERRTVEVIWSTGAPVMRFDWLTGERYLETLSLESRALRLTRLNRGAPVLNAHGTLDIADQIGVVEEGSARIENGRARAVVRFSRRADVEPIWQDVQDKILRNVSVGYIVHTYEQTAAAESQPLRRHAVDWEPYEISIVPIAADAEAQMQIRAGRPRPTHPCAIIPRCPPGAGQGAAPMRKRQIDPNGNGECPEGYGKGTDGLCHLLEMDADADGACPPGYGLGEDGRCHLLVLEPEEESAMDEETRTGTRRPAPVLVEQGPGPSLAPLGQRAEEPSELERGIVAERERIEGIIRGVRAAKFSGDFADELIRSGVTLEQARGKILDKLAEIEAHGGHVGAPAAPGPSPRPWPIRVERVADPNVWTGIRDALLYRISPGKFKLEGSARQYHGLSLLETARVCLQARGLSTVGLSKLELAALALNMRGPSGYHTTSDFADILVDVATKTLRQAYQEAPQTFELIATRKNPADFKPTRSIQVGEAPALLKVLEHGEFERGTIGAGKEEYRLETFGRVFAITRQALINDDTDAFGTLTVMFGRAARNLESDVVWAQITGNPVMGDGTTLFHADHGNLAASGAVISVATIGAGRVAMGTQRGLDGEQFLNLSPTYLFVPKAIETAADIFVTPITPATVGAGNPFVGRLTVISEPRLDASSATAWYLVASPGQIDIIHFGTLEGEPGPTVETRVGFDIDGLEIKCRHDFAAKVIDWRGVYRNPGA